MCYTDLDMPKFFREDTVRARKEHQCCECFQPIAKGEIHQVVAGRWAFGVDTYRTCARCYYAREMLAALEREDGCADYEARPGFTQLSEAWNETQNYNYRGPLLWPDWPELTDVPRW